MDFEDKHLTYVSRFHMFMNTVLAQYWQFLFCKIQNWKQLLHCLKVGWKDLYYPSHNDTELQIWWKSQNQFSQWFLYHPLWIHFSYKITVTVAIRLGIWEVSQIFSPNESHNTIGLCSCYSVCRQNPANLFDHLISSGIHRNIKEKLRKWCSFSPQAHFWTFFTPPSSYYVQPCLQIKIAPLKAFKFLGVLLRPSLNPHPWAM